MNRALHERHTFTDNGEDVLRDLHILADSYRDIYVSRIAKQAIEEIERLRSV